MIVTYRAFADRRGYLIMSLSQSRTLPTVSLYYSTMKNIMSVLKTVVRP